MPGATERGAEILLSDERALALSFRLFEAAVLGPPTSAATAPVGDTDSVASIAAAASPIPPPRTLKILVLHGWGQDGALGRQVNTWGGATVG